MLTSLISQNDCIWMSGCHAVEREALDVMDAIASPPARTTRSKPPGLLSPRAPPSAGRVDVLADVANRSPSGVAL